MSDVSLPAIAASVGDVKYDSSPKVDVCTNRNITPKLAAYTVM
jgi:hypothetical protein